MSHEIKVAGQSVTVDVARDQEERYIGLSEKEDLGPDEGMLFVWPTEKEHGLVMRDMDFGLDMVFANASGTVTKVASRGPDDDDSPTAFSKYAVELPRGWCKKAGVEEGDSLELSDEGLEKSDNPIESLSEEIVADFFERAEIDISMFTALADETPDPTVEEVDAPYNEVEGETPDGQTQKMDGVRDDWESKDDPCWDGYEQVGMKEGENGEKVPNCVPEDEAKARKNVRKAANRVFKVRNFVNSPYSGDAEVDGNQLTFTPPFSKDEAEYRAPEDTEYDENHKNCRSCAFYVEGGGCVMVQGEIDSDAYCENMYSDVAVSGHAHDGDAAEEVTVWGDEYEWDESLIEDFAEGVREILAEKEGIGKAQSIVKEWIPYVGPEGGEGWQEAGSGEVRYQTDPPGDVHEDYSNDYWDRHNGEDYPESERRPDNPDEGVAVTAFTDEIPDLEIEESSSEDFVSGVERKIEKDPEMGAFLTEHDPEEMEDHTTLRVKGDGVDAGVSVSPDGDVQNLFKIEGPSGTGRALLEEAIDNGGRTLDCYAGYLNRAYRQHGFREVARQEFNPDFAPDDWNYEKYGQPDVVFMSYSPDTEPERTDRYIDDWGEAKDLTRERANTEDRGNKMEEKQSEIRIPEDEEGVKEIASEDREEEMDEEEMNLALAQARLIGDL